MNCLLRQGRPLRRESIFEGYSAVTRMQDNHEVLNAFVFIAGRLPVFFTGTRCWYRHGEARELVFAYYHLLRSVRRTFPKFAFRMARCSHCAIVFFTDPANKDRIDLRCPFGCRGRVGRERLNARAIAEGLEAVAGGATETTVPILRHIRHVIFLATGTKYSVLQVWGKIHAMLVRHRIRAWGSR